MWCFHRSRRKWSCFVQPLFFIFLVKCNKMWSKSRDVQYQNRTKDVFPSIFISMVFWRSLTKYQRLQTKVRCFRMISKVHATATFSDNHGFFCFYFIEMTAWEMLSSAATLCFPWSKRSCRKYDRLKSMRGGSFSMCWSHLKNIIHFPHALISHCTLAEYWWGRTCILVTQTKRSSDLLCRH